MEFSVKAQGRPNPLGGGAGGMREQLARVDAMINWSAFDKFLRWIHRESSDKFGHEPRTMLKALLLKQWFQLRSHEFELEVADRASFREFMSLAPGASIPSHTSVAQFGHLLWERGIGEEVFGELTRQLTEQRLRGANEGSAHEHSSDKSSSQPLGIGLDYFGAQVDFLRYGTETRPPEWREIEASFKKYWNSLKRITDLPSPSSVKLSEAGMLRPHLAIIRVVDDGDDFIYEYVGTRIQERNAGGLVGMSLRAKAAYNLTTHGHYGLQGELFALFRSAMIHGQPIGTSAYFANVAHEKCQIWSIVAPLADENGRASMLLGAALIAPVTVN